MRRTVALAVLILASCSSTTVREAQEAARSDATPQPTAADPAGPVAAARAPRGPGKNTAVASVTRAGKAASVARVRRPISIGVLITDTAVFASAGMSQGNSLSEEKVVRALVDAMNDRGGLSGRRIEPVFATTAVGSASPEGDFQAACATFTQDNHVEAVLGYNFAFYESFEGCLKEAGVPHLSTTFSVPDQVAMSRFPTLLSLANPVVERRSIAKIDGAVATGWLTKRSKLGVLRDECAPQTRSWSGIVLPYLKRRGLTPVETATFGCPQNVDGVTSAITAGQNAVLRFHAAGIDRIMLHTVSESGAMPLLANYAESQGYRPGYIMSSLADTAAPQAPMPDEQSRNVRSFGWLPYYDVPPNKYPPLTAPAKRCLQLIRSKGVNPAAAGDYFFAFSACDAFFLYEAGLKSTNGRNPLDVILGGMPYVSASTLGGKLSFTKVRRDGPVEARPVIWNQPCRCFVYTGKTREIP